MHSATSAQTFCEVHGSGVAPSSMASLRLARDLRSAATLQHALMCYARVSARVPARVSAWVLRSAGLRAEEKSCCGKET